MLSACSAAAPTNGGKRDAVLPSENVAQIGALKPPVLDTTLSSLMDGLLADGGSGSGSSCISPLSYKLALAMAYNGAKGDTADLLQQLFGASPDEMNAWAAAYLETAQAYDGKAVDPYAPTTPELRIANSYWLRKGLEREIAKEFTNVLTDSYNAESGRFDDKPDPINKWVGDATHGKIKDILTTVGPAALSYLVNALYFNAQWANDFDENSTAPGEFTNIDGNTATTDMLHGGADRYIDTSEFTGMTKALYGGFTFTAVMPKSDAFPTLQSIIEAQKSADDSYTSILLTIPKVDFDTNVNFREGGHPEFDALFAHHGMDGALAENAKTDDLLISEIIHKTTFTLAEAGIEASAATVMAITEGAAAPIEPKVVEIVFDKPFWFTLTDREGEVLFVGRVLAL
jgi:serpin B